MEKVGKEIAVTKAPLKATHMKIHPFDLLSVILNGEANCFQLHNSKGKITLVMGSINELHHVRVFDRDGEVNPNLYLSL